MFEADSMLIGAEMFEVVPLSMRGNQLLYF